MDVATQQFILQLLVDQREQGVVVTAAELLDLFEISEESAHVILHDFYHSHEARAPTFDLQKAKDLEKSIQKKSETDKSKMRDRARADYVASGVGEAEDEKAAMDEREGAAETTVKEFLETERKVKAGEEGSESSRSSSKKSERRPKKDPRESRTFALPLGWGTVLDESGEIIYVNVLSGERRSKPPLIESMSPTSPPISSPKLKQSQSLFEDERALFADQDSDIPGRMEERGEPDLISKSMTDPPFGPGWGRLSSKQREKERSHTEAPRPSPESERIGREKWEQLANNITDKMKDRKAMINLLKSLKAIAKNLLKPEDSYRTLYSGNQKLQDKVLAYDGGYEFILELGFRNKDSTKLVCDSPDTTDIRLCISVMQSKIEEIAKRRRGARRDARSKSPRATASSRVSSRLSSAYQPSPMMPGSRGSAIRQRTTVTRDDTAVMTHSKPMKEDHGGHVRSQSDDSLFDTASEVAAKRAKAGVDPRVSALLNGEPMFSRIKSDHRGMLGDESDSEDDEFKDGIPREAMTNPGPFDGYDPYSDSDEEKQQGGGWIPTDKVTDAGPEEEREYLETIDDFQFTATRQRSRKVRALKPKTVNPLDRLSLDGPKTRHRQRSLSAGSAEDMGIKTSEAAAAKERRKDEPKTAVASTAESGRSKYSWGMSHARLSKKSDPFQKRVSETYSSDINPYAHASPYSVTSKSARTLRASQRTKTMGVPPTMSSSMKPSYGIRRRVTTTKRESLRHFLDEDDDDDLYVKTSKPAKIAPSSVASYGLHSRPIPGVSPVASRRTQKPLPFQSRLGAGAVPKVAQSLPHSSRAAGGLSRRFDAKKSATVVDPVSSMKDQSDSDEEWMPSSKKSSDVVSPRVQVSGPVTEAKKSSSPRSPVSGAAKPLPMRVIDVSDKSRKSTKSPRMRKLGKMFSSLKLKKNGDGKSKKESEFRGDRTVSISIGGPSGGASPVVAAAKSSSVSPPSHSPASSSRRAQTMTASTGLFGRRNKASKAPSFDEPAFTVESSPPPMATTVVPMEMPSAEEEAPPPAFSAAFEAGSPLPAAPSISPTLPMTGLSSKKSSAVKIPTPVRFMDGSSIILNMSETMNTKKIVNAACKHGGIDVSTASEYRLCVEDAAGMAG